MSVVFLRNDIYELLVDETPGSRQGSPRYVSIGPIVTNCVLSSIVVLQASIDSRNETFDQGWSRLFVPTVARQNSLEYYI